MTINMAVRDDDGRKRKKGTGHQLKGTPEYGAWVNMRQRVNNPAGHDVFYYKDITICPEWDDVTRFVADMGLRPSDQYEIDRIDNNKGYSQENCHWVEKKPQMQNTRIAKWWWVYGVQYNSVSEAAEAHGVSISRIKAWCDGRADGKYSYPRKHGCWSVKKYPEFLK